MLKETPLAPVKTFKIRKNENYFNAKVLIYPRFSHIFLIFLKFLNLSASYENILRVGSQSCFLGPSSDYTVKNNQDRIYDQQRRKYLDQVRWQTIFDARKDQMLRLHIFNKKYNVDDKQYFGWTYYVFLPSYHLNIILII